MAVGRVDPASGSHGSGRSWLVLRELDEAAVSGLLASPSVGEALARADVGAFVFDGTSKSSFRAAAAAMEAVAMASKDQLPCVFVAAKDDLGMPTVRGLPGGYMQESDRCAAWCREVRVQCCIVPSHRSW